MIEKNTNLTPLEFVGTTKESGLVQLDLLKKEGLSKTSSFLEIGCGMLNLGIFLIEYLEPNRYVGIDPNEWLRKDVLDHNRSTFLEKNPIFLSNDSFDSSELNRSFDFIFSHSVLSHVSYDQIDQFLEKCKKVLNKKGKILSSIRLAEGNDYGSNGSYNKKDSMDKEWQYPGVSWFTMETVIKKANLIGLSVTHKKEYTEYYVNKRPGECHDWLLFEKTKI